MTSRMFASVTALCAGALAIPYAAQAQDAAQGQVQMGQQAQATPAPAAPAPAAPGAPAAPAAPAAPTSNAMTTPAMAGTLTANPNPFSVDLGPILGKTYLTGQLTGLGFVQSNAVPTEAGINPPTLPNGFTGNRTGEADLSNGMVEVQKTDGQFQYFIMAGAYSIPVVGVPYIDAFKYNSAFYGPVPEAYGKWAPTDSFSLEVGKLPTLIGEEDTFTYQNLNIERGLLWNQENVINRGVQGNYTLGPVAFALSWNDGFYSSRYTYITGSVTWTVDSSNTLVLAGGGNTSSNLVLNTYTNNPLFSYTPDEATPEPAATEQQYDLSWTWTSGPWTINPYVQYTHTPSIYTNEPGASFGEPFARFNSGSTVGGSLLVGYTFDPATTIGGMSLGGWSLPARFEYISSSGSSSGIPGTAGFIAGPNLLGYGPGSKAWEITITPTYQYKIFFARAEASFIKASSITPGAGFGTSGTNDTQVRGLLELGLLF